MDPTKAIWIRSKQFARFKIILDLLKEGQVALWKVSFSCVRILKNMKFYPSKSVWTVWIWSTMHWSQLMNLDGLEHRLRHVFQGLCRFLFSWYTWARTLAKFLKNRYLHGLKRDLSEFLMGFNMDFDKFFKDFAWTFDFWEILTDRLFLPR